MSPSISPLTSPKDTALPKEWSSSVAESAPATLATTSTMDPKRLQHFHSQYPDYDENDSDLPLWIEGVDTTYAPFIPTSTRRVLLALELARISSRDKVLDVGSGDGRFCYAAVELFGAQKATGIEFEQDLVDQSTALAQTLVDQGRIEFQRADLTDWRQSPVMLSKEWTAIIVFLSPEGGSDMEDWLVQEFERGVKIVALVFDLKHLKGLRCSYEDSQEGLWIYEKEGKEEQQL
ncbi:hypothetical protein BGZ75_000072 [Mortierella antarctica]|nr:hypothetical protein BGZ75_000072 [Mortierella antarctica]